MAASDKGVLVGYDGSPASDDALRWAVREAHQRRAMLTVCLAWAPEYMEMLGEPSQDESAERKAQHILDSGVQYARSVLSSDQVRPALIRGQPANVLVQASGAAQLIVTAARGHAGVAGVPVGPVTWQLALCGLGPVVVVRGQWHIAGHAPDPIAVGVDQSPTSQAALAFAFTEAELHSVPLLAICALADTPNSLGGARQMEADFGHMMDTHGKMHPEVTVLRQVVNGSPRTALLAAAMQAQLVVVGSRGRGGVEGMSLGSAALAVLCYASCPVAIIRPEAGI